MHSTHLGNPVLDLEAFKEIVGKFAKEAPEILSGHSKTTRLGLDIDRLKLREALEHQFTVAVVGQMKSGKSTLLNTLLDTHILPVGITETTATVNWLWYGSGDKCKNFRVYWRDGTDDAKPIEQAGDWTDESLNVSQTKYLKFFVDSPFLGVANFVDTPGTDTDKPGHEQATRDFITAKLEEETLKHGGFASAILYVFGQPTATASNAKLLDLCGLNTRLRGSSPKNSIAVVQKWEHFGAAHEDPTVLVAEHCERYREQFEDDVSEVVATCPPLALAAKHITDLDIWEELAKKGTSVKDTAAIRGLVSSQKCFSATRKEMKKFIPPEIFTAFPYWQVIRFALRLAYSRQIDDGQELRKSVKDASGIDRLKDILQTQFLDASHLHHASTILTKVARPCETAQGILQDIKENQEVDFEDAIRCLNTPSFETDIELEPVRELLQKQHRAAKQEAQHANQLLEKLLSIQEQVESIHSDFDEDIAHLSHLAKADVKDSLCKEDIEFLQRLFGKNGKSVRQRLGLEPECEFTAGIEKQVNAWFTLWLQRAETTEETILTEIYEHAATRLDQIVSYLEAYREQLSN